MRIVKWNPQERVDAPDLTSMSYLVLGEFRRLGRGVLNGDNNALIQGFLVEEAATPDTTIRVRLNPSGILGFALGSELVGARVDYGQIIGGDNSDGNLEGNAQQTLDFTGQSVDTYTVQMRFLYTDGTADNRAFWNPASNTEFISAVDTRTLPQFSLRFSGGASNEWIDLADVVWDGVGPIETADITDLREFVLEGTTPFQQTTKLGTGGIVDFNRSADRTVNGLNKVYPALRGIARQIQDIKGPDDALNWNWWNDPYLPHDPSSTLGREQTTNLRSLRTVHYTIGDGVTTYGDFNGYALGTGLDECLSHIETEDAGGNLDGRVIIQILVNGDDSATADTFKIGNYDFSTLVVEIRGGGGQRDGVTPYWTGSRIECAGTLSIEAFDISATGGNGGLILRDLDFVDPGGSAEVIRAGSQTHIELHNCNFDMSSLTVPVLEMSSGPNVLDVSNCRFVGLIQLKGNAFLTPSVFNRCRFQGTVEITGRAYTFRECNFSSIERSINEPGCVTIDSASLIRFHGCEFTGQGVGADLVHMDSDTGDLEDIWIRGCRFAHSIASTAHEPGAGTNSTNGTGWHVFIGNTSGDSDNPRGIFIEGCEFNGRTVSDSGAIFALEPIHLVISNCEFSDWDVDDIPTAEPHLDVIQLGVTPGSVFTNFMIANNHFQNYGAGSTRTAVKRYIFIVELTGSGVITGNSFTGRTAITGWTFGGVGSAAIELDNAQHVGINDNAFRGWNDTTFARQAIIADTPFYCTFGGNQFYDCHQAIAITGTGTGRNSIVNNTAYGVSSAAHANGVFYSTLAYSTMVGNTVGQYTGTYLAFNFQSGSNQVFIGNSTEDGDVNRAPGITVRGHNTTPDMNAVGGAYTTV